MLRRLIPFTTLILLGAVSHADTTHLGIYMQGTRVGDATFSDSKEVVNGRELKRGDSTTKISTNMLGGALTVEISSTSWSDVTTGRPVRMLFVTKSGGRTETVDAAFGAKYANVVLESGGPKQTKKLLIPTDGPIVDDPMPMVLKGSINSKTSFYELRPDTVSFSKDQAVNRGASKVKIGDRSFDATLVDVIDSMSTMHIYVSGKGDLIKADGPLGLEMIADTYDQPGTPIASTNDTDLAVASSIKPDKTIDSPGTLKLFKFRLNAPSADLIPNDEHQTAIKSGAGWEITVHPVSSVSAGATIAEAAKQQSMWVQPDTYIPSDSPRFKTLASQIIGKEKRVNGAAFAVQNWIASRMHPNPGIGVLRDANEVLTSKEGVCRDYAILAATLLRAGGVPTRLCSGLVSWDGTFYYHAWVEVWNGKNWIGIDPTVTDPQISAAHIKLADGNIATAFQFPVLDKVSIKVEEAVSR